MILHLAGPAAGARLAVCDARCAHELLDLLSDPACRPTAVDPLPVLAKTDCLRCAACGGIIDQPLPATCLWHPGGRPVWQYTATVTAGIVLHRLASIDALVLDDHATRLLDQLLAATADPDGRLDADAAYAAVRTRLAPP